MHYDGHFNTKCPICTDPIGAGWHPLVIRINGVVQNRKSKRVCPDCFQYWSREHGKLFKDSDVVKFERWLEEQLRETEFKRPVDYTIKGFSFELFDNGPLGLTINYQKD